MRLRFTLRDLFWLTLVAALVLGWSSDRARFQHEQVRQLIKVRELALAHWREFRAICEARGSGEWSDEAKAREQYFDCRAQLQQAETSSANPLTVLFKLK